MVKKTFILSDQTENCYGFIVLTSGINLEAFKKNPVMLYNHKNDGNPNDVIGKWENIRVEGTQLLADAIFDGDDDYAKKIADKVEKDFIKGASIRFDFDFEDVVLGHVGYEETPVITKCEITEASIVAVPGNSNAVKLYANGEQVKDKSMALSLSNKNNPQNDSMKNIAVFAAALGIALSNNTTEDHVLEAVKNLAGERDNLKLKNKELQDKLDAEQDLKIEAMLTKVPADQKEKYKKLAKADFDSTKSIVDALVPHKTITEQLNGGGEQGAKKDKYEGWDFKKFQKEGSVELARIRKEEPARYKELYLAAYPGAKYND